MLIQKGNRETAIHALINTWLKDPTVRCGWCGRDYIKDEVCCEQPFIATNDVILEQHNRELKRVRNTRLNKHASTKDKTIRWGLSFPPGLLEFLTTSFKKYYEEDLFNKEYDTAWFAKKFGKYFCVPEQF